MEAALSLVTKMVEGVGCEVERSHTAARATILHSDLDRTTAWHGGTNLLATDGVEIWVCPCSRESVKEQLGDSDNVVAVAEGLATSRQTGIVEGRITGLLPEEEGLRALSGNISTTRARIVVVVAV